MGNAVSSADAPRAAVAPHNQQDKAGGDRQAQTASTEQHPSEPFWKSAFDDPVAAFTLWLAVATTGLWLFTAGLWYATYGTLRIVRDTARRQLRAYVGIASAGLTFRKPTPVDDTNTHVSLVLQNFGQTPARFLFMKLRVQIVHSGAHDDSVDYPYGKADPVGENQVLNPSQIFSAGTDFNLSTDNHDKISNDISKVVIFGQFAFEDEFGRRSTFDFLYGSSGRDFTNGDLRVELLKKHD